MVLSPRRLGIKLQQRMIQRKVRIVTVVTSRTSTNRVGRIIFSKVSTRQRSLTFRLTSGQIRKFRAPFRVVCQVVTRSRLRLIVRSFRLNTSFMRYTFVCLRLVRRFNSLLNIRSTTKRIRHLRSNLRIKDIRSTVSIGCRIGRCAQFGLPSVKITKRSPGVLRMPISPINTSHYHTS